MTWCVKNKIPKLGIEMKLKTRSFLKCEILRKLALGACLVLPQMGCNEEYVPQRETRDYGSFGTELFNIVYDNSANSKAYSSAEFLNAFMDRRDIFITAVDTSAVEADLDALNQVFVDIVPLYENMLYPGTLRKVAVVVDELRASPDAVAASAWLAESPQLLQTPARVNPFAQIFTYDDVSGLTDELLSLLLRNAGTERNATNQLLKEISNAFRDISPTPDKNDLIHRAVDMLLDSDKAYAPQGLYTPLMAVALDWHGLPKIAPRHGTSVYAPFVDEDGDGTADINDVGFFKLTNGTLVAPYEHFGALPDAMSIGDHGALLYENTPVFETFDLQQTPLAYLLREGDALLADATLDQALRALQSLLGTPAVHHDDDGSYTGFPEDSGVLQLLAAVLTTLDHESVGPNFEAVIELLTNHKNTVARIIYDLETIVDIYDETPNHFSLNNDLLDRLLPEVRKLSETPGLLADLFEALDDPMSAEIAPILSELALRKKNFIVVDPNGAYEKCFQICDEKYDVGSFDRLHCIRACPTDEVLGKEFVDHTQPESLENRSLFQRTTHLMWETSETPYHVTAEKLVVGEADLTSVAVSFGTLISFENLAQAYLQTISGDLHLADHLSSTFTSIGGLIGADGTTVAGLLSYLVKNMFDLKLSVDPKTSEVTRLFNKAVLSSRSENYTFDLETAVCRSGFKCLQANADVLFALEASGLVDALYPVVKVFNDHDASHILARIVAIIFEYYTTGDMQYLDAKGDPLPLYTADFRSLEPMLARALDETTIISDVGALGDALLSVPLADGSKLTDRFEKFVAYLLTPDASLRKLNGHASTTDRTGNIIAPLSPAYLYIDALRDISDFLDINPTTDTQLSDALTRIKDITIHTVREGDGSIHFEKPAGIQLLASAVRVLHDIYLDKNNDGTLHTWIHDDAIPDLVDIVSGRLVYAAFRLFDDLDAHPAGLERFRSFVLHLMESGSDEPTHLLGSAYVLASFLLEQHQISALARVFASPLDPDRVWTTEGFAELSFVVTLLTCVDAFNECDPSRVFNNVFYNLFETKSRNRMNIVRLLDIAEALFREKPGDKTQRTIADQKLLLDFIYDLFTDNDRGVERIYQVIDFTIWGNDRRPDDWKPEDASWQIRFD